MEVALTLPIPPSINHYYGANVNGSRRVVRYIKPAGKIFRKEVIVAASEYRGVFGGEDRLALRALLFLPAGGDLDNRAKPLLDALQHAGVFPNDSQIDELHIKRGYRVRGGRCEVTIWRL